MTLAISTRFYSFEDIDLIEFAIKQSGLSRSEWIRQSLLTMAELQSMKGGMHGIILKNMLLVRHLIQSSPQIKPEQISESMTWATSEFEEIISSNNRKKHHDKR